MDRTSIYELSDEELRGKASSNHPTVKGYRARLGIYECTHKHVSYPLLCTTRVYLAYSTICYSNSSYSDLPGESKASLVSMVPVVHSNVFPPDAA